MPTYKASGTEHLRSNRKDHVGPAPEPSSAKGTSVGGTTNLRAERRTYTAGVSNPAVPKGSDHSPAQRFDDDEV